MKVATVADGLGFVEGPVVLPDGLLGVASMSRGSVLILTLDGAIVSEYELGGGPNGLTVGPDGTLYVAQNGGLWAAQSRTEPGIQIIHHGRVDYLVREMDAPNDLVFGPDGRLWVTDSREEVDFRHPDKSPPGRIWAVDIRTGDVELITDGPLFINGIGLSLDARTLYVTETVHAHVTAYQLDHGRLGEGRILTTLADARPDGFAVDTVDRLWIATTSGDRIDVVGADGTLIDRHQLPSGSMPTNVCCGPDPDIPEFFVTAAGSGALLKLTPA